MNINAEGIFDIWVIYGEQFSVNDSSTSCQLRLTEPSCALSCFFKTISLLSIDSHLSAVAFSIVFLVLPSAEPRESRIAALSPASPFSQQNFNRKPTLISRKHQNRLGVLKRVRSPGQVFWHIYSADWLLENPRIHATRKTRKSKSKTIQRRCRIMLDKI